MPDILQEIKDAFKTILDEVRRVDDYVNKQQKKIFRRNEEYWAGIQNIFWDEIAQDWRIPTSKDLAEVGLGESFYDFVVNIYQAHGKSIISALNAEIPNTLFFPDNSESVDDIQTAKVYSRCSTLIQKHNKPKLLFLKICFYLFNHGNAYIYNYNEPDENYGTHEIDVTELQDRKVGNDSQLCPNCGTVLGEIQPITDESGALQGGEAFCPTCGSQVTPTIKEAPMQKVQVKVGTKEIPTNGEHIEVYGGLNVKVSYYARERKDCGYVLLSGEQHYGLAKSIYPDISADITPGQKGESEYDRWMRTPVNYLSGYRTPEEKDLVTIDKLWLRPWMFETVKDDTIREKLKNDYPDGCRIVFVGDVFAEARKEKLDRHWVVIKAEDSAYIHANPMGNPVVGIQDIKNTMTNLMVETTEHGIPWTVADPEVLDFDKYENSEAVPGAVYPGKAQPGKTMEQAFYTAKTSHLSPEVGAVMGQTEKDAQFVLGDFPSLYGGPSPAGSSKTLGEYVTSRNQAMQRLSIPWSMITEGWSEVMKNAVEDFLENMAGEVKYTQKVSDDNYVTVWIRKAEATGKVGSVEPETDNIFPVSAAQQRDALMSLIQLNNPVIMQALMSPDNISLFYKAIGIPDLKFPGQSQTYKQYREIADLIKGSPVEIPGPTDPMTGQPLGPPMLMPSVPTEPEVDDDLIHGNVLSEFIVSPYGQDLKVMKPDGYHNCIAHLEQHRQNLMNKVATQQQMGQVPQPQENENADVLDIRRGRSQ